MEPWVREIIIWCSLYCDVPFVFSWIHQIKITEFLSHGKRRHEMLFVVRQKTIASQLWCVHKFIGVSDFCTIFFFRNLYRWMCEQSLQRSMRFRLRNFAPTESHTERLNSLETMDSRLALKMNANAARTRVIIQMQMRSPNIDVYIYIYIYIRSIRFVERVERLTVFSVPNVLFRLVTLSVSGLVPCAP